MRTSSIGEWTPREEGVSIDVSAEAGEPYRPPKSTLLSPSPMPRSGAGASRFIEDSGTCKGEEMPNSRTDLALDD